MRSIVPVTRSNLPWDLPLTVTWVTSCPPGTLTRKLEVNLVAGDSVTGGFPWAVVGISDIVAIASAADCKVTEARCVDERWFAWLAA